MAPFTGTKIAGSKCRSIFRTLFRLGTLGVKRRVFSNSPMMHCARDSFIQDGRCFGLVALDNRINNNPHKNLGRPNRIGYNCPGFGSLQVPISNKNYIPFRMSRRLKDDDIEDLLARIENGDIFEDEEDMGV
ncbi:hypothetical protein TNCV_463181 [Trichonephila clavipes]|nr:hypothetical protein TNCV_463181 [Trichonephila clavipes]